MMSWEKRGAAERPGPMKRGVILFSGGLDSVALAILLRRKGYSLRPVYMSHRANVGNVTKKELVAASKLARKILGEELTIVKAPAKGREPRWYQDYGTVEYSNKLPVSKARKDRRNRVFLDVLNDLGMADGVVALGILDQEATERNRSRWPDIRTADLRRYLAKKSSGGRLVTLTSAGYKDKVCAIKSVGPISSKDAGYLFDSESCLMYFNKPCGNCASCKDRAGAFKRAYGRDRTPYRPESAAGRMNRQGRANRRVGWLERLFGPPRGTGHRSQRFFRVTSPAQGLKVIKDPAITANWRKSLAWRPKHRTAVLVPCAATKPFPEAPSHKSGYLKGIGAKKVDVWVVSEPLGIIPYSWSRKWPNDSYDFPPEHLQGAAYELLAERMGEWFDRVAPKYEKIYLALPRHHARLIQSAIGDRAVEGIDVGIGACLKANKCATGEYRATTHAYRDFLKGKLRA